jgi:hypothetical protein
MRRSRIRWKQKFNSYICEVISLAEEGKEESIIERRPELERLACSEIESVG